MCQCRSQQSDLSTSPVVYLCVSIVIPSFTATLTKMALALLSSIQIHCLYSDKKFCAVYTQILKVLQNNSRFRLYGRTIFVPPFLRRAFHVGYRLRLVYLLWKSLKYASSCKLKIKSSYLLNRGWPFENTQTHIQIRKLPNHQNECHWKFHELLFLLVVRMHF